MSDDADGVAQATRWLERITADPMADAVSARVRVEEVSDVGGHRRYQPCRLRVTAEGPGIPPTTVTVEAVIDRRFWPRVGQVLPARISVTDPTVVEIVWDALRR